MIRFPCCSSQQFLLRRDVIKMSGHSKWSTIKHQKGVTDARRGQLFTKLAREITVAARAGGDNPDMNVRLRMAIQKARENNMPQDNVCLLYTSPSPRD